MANSRTETEKTSLCYAGEYVALHRNIWVVKTCGMERGQEQQKLVWWKVHFPSSECFTNINLTICQTIFKRFVLSGNTVGMESLLWMCQSNQQQMKLELRLSLQVCREHKGYSAVPPNLNLTSGDGVWGRKGPVWPPGCGGFAWLPARESLICSFAKWLCGVSKPLQSVKDCCDQAGSWDGQTL